MALNLHAIIPAVFSRSNRAEAARKADDDARHAEVVEQITTAAAVAFAVIVVVSIAMLMGMT